MSDLLDETISDYRHATLVERLYSYRWHIAAAIVVILVLTACYAWRAQVAQQQAERETSAVIESLFLKGAPAESLPSEGSVSIQLLHRMHAAARALQANAMKEAFAHLYAAHHFRAQQPLLVDYMVICALAIAGDYSITGEDVIALHRLSESEDFSYPWMAKRLTALQALYTAPNTLSSMIDANDETAPPDFRSFLQLLQMINSKP